MQWYVVSTYNMYERNSAKILIDAQCTHTLRSNCRDHFFSDFPACMLLSLLRWQTYLHWIAFDFFGGKSQLGILMWSHFCSVFITPLMCVCAAALPVLIVLMTAVGRMHPPTCSFIDLLIQSYSVSQTGLNLLMKPWLALTLHYCFPYCRPTDAGI